MIETQTPTQARSARAGPRARLSTAAMVTLVILGFCVPLARGQQRTCTTTEAQQAEREADGLRSWDALYSSYKRFGHCDDGAIAEGYSESVARILVDHWGTLGRLRVLAKRDSGFRKFVVNHVDETLNMDDVKRIRENATDRCPKGLDGLCKQLRAAADRP